MGKFIQYCTKESLYEGTYNEGVWHAPGMGDVIVTENRRLIVIDGGLQNDADGLLKLLEKEAGNQIPVVDAWIITHAHADHYGCLQAIGRGGELKSRLRVKKIVYWFPAEFGSDGKTSPEIINGNRDMDEICISTGAEAHRPKRGEKMVVDDTEIRFLYVPDDCSVLNTKAANCNYCSLIFTVKGKNKKAMITGDAFERTLNITAWRYGRDLKCDILQMPHHSFCDAYSEEFYECVDARIVLLPVSKGGYRDMRSEKWISEKGNVVNLTAIAKADEVYKAFEGSAELEL